LRIEGYFAHIQSVIEACPVLQTFNITYDKRSTYEGFIHGELIFVDDSRLHLREFVDVETGVDRLTHVYQYMTAEQVFVFRYDNTGHHRKLNLSTYPHHKHDGRENNVTVSSAPDLAGVLREIQTRLTLPA
jgi:hypothetical protein